MIRKAPGQSKTNLSFNAGLVPGGVRASGIGPDGPDADATAFMTATGIPDDGTVFYAGTPQEVTGAAMWAAINAFVVKLKADGVWSKCSVIYPMIGGTADRHKLNLKDPRDLNAAFRITWNGTVSHNELGVQGISSGYGNTYFTPLQFPSDYSMHIGVYSQTTGASNTVEIGMAVGGASSVFLRSMSGSPGSGQVYLGPNDRFLFNLSQTATGFFLASRQNSSSMFVNQDGKMTARDCDTAIAYTRQSQPIYLLCLNNSGSAAVFSPRRVSFATIGGGLSDQEAKNYDDAVASLHTALGRRIAAYDWSDVDADAYLSVIGNTDTTIQQAVRVYVKKIKEHGWWTDYIGIYPMIGGTANACKINLKDPRDLDAAHRIAWNGGLTFDAEGVTGNGSSGYGNTFISPFTSLTTTTQYMTVANRTALPTGYQIGADDLTGRIGISLGTGGASTYYAGNTTNAEFVTGGPSDPINCFTGTRSSPGAGISLWLWGANGNQFGSPSATTPLPNQPLYILAKNTTGTATDFSNSKLTFVAVSKRAGAGATVAYTYDQAFISMLGKKIYS